MQINGVPQGPRKLNTLDGHFTGPDTIARNVIRDGKERPRPLDYEETAVANANRSIAFADELALTRWQDNGFISGPPDIRTRPEPEPEPERPKREGDEDEEEVPSIGTIYRPEYYEAAQPWQPVNAVLKRMHDDEQKQWTPDALAAESLIDAVGGSAGCRKHGLEQSPGPRGGGVQGRGTELAAAWQAMTA